MIKNQETKENVMVKSDDKVLMQTVSYDLRGIATTIFKHFKYNELDNGESLTMANHS